MRILAISDEVSTLLYSQHMQDVVGDVDVLIGCGDLPYEYMEFVVTQARVRNACFVHGNHDHPVEVGSRLIETPGGWTNVDRRVVYLRDYDLLIAGLEGSIRYTPHGAHQYGARQMAWRALRLIPQLLWSRAWHGRYLDILIAHSPPAGIHDRPSGAHRGFPVFVRLIERFKPRLMLHGHVHHYGRPDWHVRYHDTDVVNVVPYCAIELDDHTVSYTSLHNH